jgi:protein-tyrosine-phosphatase
MLGAVLQTAVKYVKDPLREKSYFLTRWLRAVRDRSRWQRLVREQAFPKDIKHILIICKGNICRSPLAEAYLKHVLEQRMVSVALMSAGLETSLGKPAHRWARAVGESKGIVLESHTTQPLLREHAERADLIVVMEFAQRHRLLKLFPEAKEKIFLLRQFAGSRDMDITDPYSGTLREFEECFDVIRQSCDCLVEEICRFRVNR